MFCFVTKNPDVKNFCNMTAPCMDFVKESSIVCLCTDKYEEFLDKMILNNAHIPNVELNANGSILES